MDSFPSCDPNAGWPYFADENLEPGGSEGVQLRDLFDQSTDATSTFSGSHTICLPSYLLPLDDNITPISSSSANNSYFDPDLSAKNTSIATWDQSVMYGVPDNRETACSQHLHNDTLDAVNHGATSQRPMFPANHELSLDENADAAYKNWQSSPHREVLGADDQASYASILEKLNQMDASMVVDSVVSSANFPDVYTYSPHSTKRTRPQSPPSESYTSTSLSPVIEATLLPSPVSSENRSLKALRSPVLKKRPPFKKLSTKVKIPHSAVEKKYRSNLNSKMIELQQCLPTFHVNASFADESGSLESIMGSPKQDGKLPKGLILENAADYIRTLEARTSRLDAHVELLERRLAVLQRIALGKPKGADAGLMTADRKDKKGLEARKSSSISNADASATSSPGASPIAISRQTSFDAGIKRSHSTVETDQSGDFETGSISPPAKRRRASRNKIVKVAVGSLLGLALWEGYNEAELPASAQSHRGLFALPVDLLTLIVRGHSAAVLGPDQRLHHYIFGYVWALTRMLLLVGIGTYALTAILLGILHWSNLKNEKAVAVASLSTLPLPLTVAFCRDAWATAIQEIHVPRDGVICEVAALVLKAWKLILRSLFGWRGYSYLTGATPESEIGRVKNWDIALDAQLAGGDSHVCTRRLLLTFLASMTIEDTPLRLMRKSLHVQMIFWNFSSTRLGRRLGIASIARGLADHFWRKAGTLQNSMKNAVPSANDTAELLAVPGYRWSLMNQASQAVFADSIVIRLVHVARNEPWEGSHITADEGMDAVFDDVAIRSPLDALAALFSSLILRDVLLATLGSGNKGYSGMKTELALHLALATAPPGSRAGMRARAAQAVFFESNRVASITAALKEMPKHHELDDVARFRFTEASVASICTTNVRIALRSAALIMGASSRDALSFGPNQSTILSMVGIIERMLRAFDVTILGFATAYRCAKVCHAYLKLHNIPGPELRSLTRRLQLIAASEWSSKYGVDRAVIEFENED